MAKIDVLNSYETLLIRVEEVRAGLGSLHDWLDRDINWDSQCDLYDFIAQYSSQFAVLRLIMYRLDDLAEEHQEIINKAVAEKE